jgi:hypothetical protein
MSPDECEDECTFGSRQCSGDGYQVCGEHDADPCLDWGAEMACPSGETCSDGSCGGTCTNECTMDAQRCAPGGFNRCGNFDADSCLEWGGVEACPSAETCSAGMCSSTCMDECMPSGSTQCSSSGGGTRMCGNFDADSCLEFGPTTSCSSGQTCRASGSSASCVAACSCDYNMGICEPAARSSTAPCTCDPDCTGGAMPCQGDGHCDTWCPAGVDPDCTACACDYNPYCEAASMGSSATCACDPSCDLNEVACADDAHCDTWCPSGADPDCGRAVPCEARWINVGYRRGNQLTLDGDYTAPDPTEGGYWIELSPSLGTGTAEMTVRMAADERSCVRQIRVEAYGYDNSASDTCLDFGFADGASIFIYNNRTSRFDLLPDAIDSNVAEWHRNDIGAATLSDYLRCATGEDYCYVRAKVEGSGWDCTHLSTLQIQVYLSP